MRQKWSLIVGLGLLLELALVASSGASTAGVPGIQTATTAMLATIKGVGYALSVVLIIASVAVIHHGQSIGGVVLGLLSAGIVVAVILFAEDFVNFIKPDAASAFTGLWPLEAGLRQVWADMGMQVLWYGAVTWTLARIRRVLHGR
jgi:hypothetical protein